MLMHHRKDGFANRLRAAEVFVDASNIMERLSHLCQTAVSGIQQLFTVAL
jgi:hypothetical protein